MLHPSIREILTTFKDDPLLMTQLLRDNGSYLFYDWFCNDSSLRNKASKLLIALSQIAGSRRINVDSQYVFFKNNCPGTGCLYDDFRVCDRVTGDVIYTIVPRDGHSNCSEFRRACVYGRENDFKEPLVAGAWRDVVSYFCGIGSIE